MIRSIYPATRKGALPVKKMIAVLLLILMIGFTLPSSAESQLPVKWNGETVELKTPGSSVSVIRSGRDQLSVPSSELSWESSTNTRFAYVYAPGTGKINMRMAPRSKASIVCKIAAGKIVLVFERTEDWCGILYDGLVGYVQTNTVRFIERPETPRATATLSYKGKTNSSTKVVMRLTAKSNGRVVTKQKPGQSVVIIEQGSVWSEVELNGWHGFILNINLSDIQLPSYSEDLPDPQGSGDANDPGADGHDAEPEIRDGMQVIVEDVELE